MMKFNKIQAILAKSHRLSVYCIDRYGIASTSENASETQDRLVLYPNPTQTILHIAPEDN